MIERKSEIEIHQNRDNPYAERPWLRHYPANVPATFEPSDNVLPDFLRDAATRYPNRAALTYFGRHISYSELDRLSSQFANRLMEHGLKKGDPVLVILANIPQFPIAHFGILKAGGVVAALSPLLVEREIAQLAADSGARIVVALDRVWDRINPIVQRGEIDVAIVARVQDYLPTLKRLLYPVKYRKELVHVHTGTDKGIHDFRTFLKGAAERDPRVNVSPEDIAAFQYTGGTTGLPKAAVLTHRNLTSNVQQIRYWVPDLIEGQETLMAILPFFHSFGVTLGLHLASQLAATTILVPRFDITDVMSQIARYHPTLLPGVPTLYNAINGAAENNPERQQALKSIRICVSGGAPLPRGVQERFEAISGGRLVEGYGLSEASPVTHANPLDGRSRIGTIGMPLPLTESMIVDPDTRVPVAIGERGEIVVRGPQIMREYWKRPEDTAAVLSSDGWLFTGDIGIMDEDGFFSIVDRKKDVIITGGENIYPREIEEVLYSHPKILEAAVIGVTHPVGGQVAKAFIVPKPGERLDRKEVLQFCGERLAKFKVPRLIEFRDSLPKAGPGKILRRALLEEEAQKPRRGRGSSTGEEESASTPADPGHTDDAESRG